ncbi:MAG: hypothetical protein JSR00_02530 [Bacteroidetes bacterium]|nr:hypothetical protein [Bacteroidota bacterium]
MTDQILINKTASILLIEERDNNEVIICAPHHTLGGVKDMPCPEHTDGDENTGFIARQLAEQIKSSSVIACNYRIDPNKNLTTDYSTQIAKWKPKYLIEIHGHGARKRDNFCIEVSSGKIERNEISKLFATTLKNKFRDNDILKDYKVCGDFNHIYFKAAKTATIIDDRWTPIHIELPPSIRLDKDSNLPTFAAEFIKYLNETISEICK